jgi:hypothetical protein
MGKILLLAILSDNCQSQAQNNAVVPAQKIMDRVGFEPTTSASFLQRQLNLLSNGQQQSKENFISNRTRSTILL